MPTGYTAGIFDGTINSFEKFAMKCSRAFGATIHMRDDSLDEEYRKRTVDSYYFESVDDNLKRINKLKLISDEELIQEETDNINQEISYCENKIKECEEHIIKFSSIIGWKG